MACIALASCLAAMAATAPAHAAGVFPFEGSAWNWGFPEPQGETLNAIDVAGSQAFAVTSGGTLLRSSDGARTWSWVGHSGGLGLDTNGVQILDPETVIASGCNVVRSDDGGRTFRTRDIPSSICAKSVDFTAPDTGFAAVDEPGGQVAVLATIDGGATFERRGVIPTGRFNATVSIDFADASTGVAAVATSTTRGKPLGLIARTTDGGRSWRVVAESTQELHSILLADGPIAYAVGDDGALLRSSDGGSTWTRRALAGVNSADLISVRCYGPDDCLFIARELDRRTGIAVDRVVRSTDGGATVAHRTERLGSVGAIDVAGDRGAVATGFRGATLLSADGARSFTVSGGAADRFTSVQTAPGRVLALRFAPRPGLGTSLNGGRSWTVSDLPAHGEVSFGDERVAYLLSSRCRGSSCRGRTTRLHRSRDAGRTWVRAQSSTTGEGEAKLHAAGPRTILVAHGRRLLRSADRGRTLRRVGGRPVGRAAIGGFDRAEGRVYAWAPRRLVVSGTQGRRWRRMRRPRGHLIAALDAVSRRAAFVLTRRGVVLRTVDGGRNWRRTARPSGRPVQAISFVDARHGFADASVDPSGSGDFYDFGSPATLYTDDGGRTWQRRRIGGLGPLHDIAATGPDSAVAAFDGDLFWTGGPE